jgi:ACS family hexuronate transporter-like MFS transporter
MTRYRWVILTLLFLITTNNYLDRIVFSTLIPIIREDLHISTEYYGYINAAFKLTYTVGFLFMGKVVDRWGTRIGYSISIFAWSVAAALHATARSTMQLGVWRGLLGLGESGNFPAAIKGVAEWFPVKERALANGLFNSGTTLASIIGPPLFVWMAAVYGWRACFLVTGGTGFVLVMIWWAVYRLPEMHPSVNQAELAYIKEDAAGDAAPQIGWMAALTFKETWGFALAKFLTDPVWWFYLEWLPPYLYDVRRFNMAAVGWAIPVVYVTAGVGSVAGGWLSGRLISRGWQHGTARKTAMGVCACLMPLGTLAALVPGPLLMIALVGVAAGAHQGWSANLFTTTSDIFPKQAVASVTGIGGAFGGLGGVIFASLMPGYVVSHFGYTPVFLCMGVLHLIAFFVVHKLLGRMKPVQIEVA